jgi:hexosaminidase
VSDVAAGHHLLSLLPAPAVVEALPGAGLPGGFRLLPQFSGVVTDRLRQAVARLQSAWPDAAPEGAPLVALVIDCATRASRWPALDDDERYELHVAAAGVRLGAPSEWGVLRGLATLTQLGDGAAVPALRIVDAPRFAWRGLMLDVARHFIPLPDLLRTLDGMAVFKLNVLHLHLSDDQGFRFPSRNFPELASAAHYTREELAVLVQAAADRGIRVVPELDVPGHTASWLQARPDWGSGVARPSRRFGVHDECLDPTRAEVRAAVATLFEELAEVFPDRYLHLGGDEVRAGWWEADQAIRGFMNRHALADAAALQAWFTADLVTTIAKLGRRALAWDEALHRDMPPGLTLQAWRGVTARDRVLAAGCDCVLSAPYYRDLGFPADVHARFDPAAPEPELVAYEDRLLEDARFAHVAAGMAWTRHWREQPALPAASGNRAGRLLGAEACLWAELVDERVLDVRLWSRLPALAERFWSPAVRDLDDLHERLDRALAALPRWAGIDVAADSRRLAAEAGLEDAWLPLLEQLEPVKWYGRLLGEQALAARLSGREMPKARPYDADTPLHRVVDALPPESPAARRFAGRLRDVQRGDAEARQALLDLAGVWQALPPRGAGPAELEPAAAALSDLGRVLRGVLTEALSAEEALVVARAAAGNFGEYLLAPAIALTAWLETRTAAGQRNAGAR